MKKGFTLIELLAVLVIIGVITLVTVPNIINTNKKSVDNDYKEFKQTVENATETYVELRPEVKEEIKIKGSIEITLKNVADAGLLNKNMTNPKTGKEIGEKDVNYIVTVTKNGNNLEYKFKES